jgi:hypothetical protein
MNGALDQSLREAITLGSRYIGSQHLLLGAVAVDDGTVAAVLQSVGADIGMVQVRLRSILGEANGWEALVDRAVAGIERTFGEAEPWALTGWRAPSRDKLAKNGRRSSMTPRSSGWISTSTGK